MKWRKREEEKKQWILKGTGGQSGKKNENKNEEKLKLRKKSIRQYFQVEIKIQEQILRNLLVTLDKS